MKLTKFAIERPVTTTMLFIALAFFGIMAYMNVGVNMMPKVNSPSGDNRSSRSNTRRTGKECD